MALRAHHIPQTRNSAITDYYAIGKGLGEGSKGRVVLATHSLTGVKRAVKILHKAGPGGIDDERRLTEVSILKSLDHPNVIKLYETFEDEHCLYLLMGYCEGGELFDHIIRAGRSFTEVDAAIVMRQILHAVRHMQRRGICHDDITMANVLALTTDPISQNVVTIADFGSAFRFMDADLRDLQSCGKIMSTLLCGVPSDMRGPLQANSEGPHLAPNRKQTLSKSARDLMNWLSISDPRCRPTAKEALKHAWFSRLLPSPTSEICSVVSRSVIEKVCKKITVFSGRSDVKKASLVVLADGLYGEPLRRLRDTFVALDSNGDGLLTFDELRKGLQRAGADMTPDLAQLMKSVDHDGIGVLEYTTFLAIMVDASKCTHTETSMAAFRVFDEDCDGQVTRNEMRELLLNQDVGCVGMSGKDAAEKLVARCPAEDDERGEKISMREYVKLTAGTKTVRDAPATASPHVMPTWAMASQSLGPVERGSVRTAKLASVTPRGRRKLIAKRKGTGSDLFGTKTKLVMKRDAERQKGIAVERMLQPCGEQSASLFGVAGTCDVADLDDFLDSFFNHSDPSDYDYDEGERSHGPTQQQQQDDLLRDSLEGQRLIALSRDALRRHTENFTSGRSSSSNASHGDLKSVSKDLHKEEDCSTIMCSGDHRSSISLGKTTGTGTTRLTHDPDLVTAQMRLSSGIETMMHVGIRTKETFFKRHDTDGSGYPSSIDSVGKDRDGDDSASLSLAGAPIDKMSCLPRTGPAPSPGPGLDLQSSRMILPLDESCDHRYALVNDEALCTTDDILSAPVAFPVDPLGIVFKLSQLLTCGPKKESPHRHAGGKMSTLPEGPYGKTVSL
jgi:calcium-dependent protein kinase